MIGKAFFENLAESANPVFIKELRQNFRNRRLLLVMTLMLLLQFGCSIIFSFGDFRDKDTAGSIFFLIILFAGFILSCIVCSLSAEQRFSQERADKELNYTMLTSLSPASVIIGKLESALVMIPFIYSLLLPFMAAAYFMRGISLESLLLIPFLIPILLLASLGGILAGSFGKRGISNLFTMGMIFFGFSFFSPGLFFVTRVMLGTTVDLQEFLLLLACEYVLSALLGVLLFLFTLKIISPKKSNRNFALKIYLFLLPFITLAGMLPLHAFTSSFDEEVFFTLEFLFAGGVVFLLLVTSIFEPPTAGIRTFMECPTKPVRRLLHFIFSTGFTGSLILSALIIFIPLAILPFMHFGLTERIVVYACVSCLFALENILILAHGLSWGTKLHLPPWALTLLLLIPGIVPAFRFSDASPVMQIVFMMISPLYALIMAFTGPTLMSNGNTIQFTGMLASCIGTGVLFLVFSRVFIRAFRHHRRPAEADSIKTPTPEMLGK